MADAPFDAVIRHVRGLWAAEGTRARTDGQLLQAFVRQHDQAAFAEVVRRHGPLVLGVCRHLLRQEPDAEDAFQAVFLILAQSAASVRKRESLAGWLHGVAYRVAMKARRNAARRRTHEGQARTPPPRNPAWEAAWREVQAVLDEEVQRLPAKYREPFVLCCLEHHSGAAAAHRLGVKEGTVWSRLAEARRRLQRRLTRRGVELSAVLAAAALARDGVAVQVSACLATSAVKAACAVGVAGGEVLTAEVVSAEVAALAEGVTKAMFLTKVKCGTALLLALTLLAAGAGLGAHQVLSGRQPEGKQANAPEPPAAGRDEPKSERDKQARTDRYGDPLPPGAVARIGTLRLCNGSQFTGLLYAPDGKTLISSGYYDTLHFWDPATGKELRHLRTGWVNSLALSPDGKTLAAAPLAAAPNDRPTVQLWDAATGKELVQLPVSDKGGVTALAFSPDSKRFAAAGQDRGIRLWDTGTWQETCRLTGHKRPVHQLLFLTDNRTLIAADEDKTLCWWDTVGGQQVRSVSAALHRIIVSPDGKTLAAAEATQTLRVWDAATGKELVQRSPVGEGLYCLAFSPDSQVLACGELHGTIRFVAPTTGKELRRWDEKGHVTYLAFSPDGKVLAQAGGGMIRLRDADTGKPAVQVPRLPNRVTTVAFTPDGKSLLTNCWGGAIGCWEAVTGKPRGALHGPPDGFAGGSNRVLSTALTADGKTAALVDAKGVVHLWEAATGKGLRRLDDPPATESGQVFSPDGKVLAVKHQDSAIRLWDPMTGKLLHSLPPHEDMYPHAFSLDGRMLATVSTALQDKAIRLWDTATGKELRQLGGQDGTTVSCVVFAPDGKTLVSAHSNPEALKRQDPNASLRLWDVAAGWELWRLHVPGHTVRSIAISPDGKTLAAGIAAGIRPHMILLAEMASGRERGRFEGHRSDVWSLAFSPDGRLLASGSLDHTALVWDLTGLLREGQLPTLAPAPEELERLWADLGAEDAARAYRALWALAAAAGRSIPFLGERLRPAARVEGDRVARLVADLDSDQFAVRDKARAALEELAELAEPALRKALEGGPTLELRRRVEMILEETARRGLTSEQLRVIRALEVLEHAGTPEARKLLEALAQGAPEARLTQEAKASLERLARRPAAP